MSVATSYGALLKRFDTADEVITFEKGKFEVVKIAGMTIGRASYDPGWKWTVHVRPTAKTELCEVEHIGHVVSGRARVRMRDGEEITLNPGDIFHIRAGHDSWVVGDRPYVSLHFLGAEKYAK